MLTTWLGLDLIAGADHVANYETAVRQDEFVDQVLGEMDEGLRLLTERA